MSMTEPQKLIRSLDALEQTAREIWANPAENFRLSNNDRDAIKKRLRWCIEALQGLSDRLESSN